MPLLLSPTGGLFIHPPVGYPSIATYTGIILIIKDKTFFSRIQVLRDFKVNYKLGNRDLNEASAVSNNVARRKTILGGD